MHPRPIDRPVRPAGSVWRGWVRAARACSPRSSVGAAWLAALVVVAAALLPASAQAAVAFRGASSGTAATVAGATSLTVQVTAPPSLAVNDVMLAVSRWSGSGGAAVTTTWTPAPGWTELDHNDSTGNSVSSTALFWKRATAADVSASTFAFAAAWTGGAKDAIITAGITAFSGADPTGSPFGWESAAQVQGNPPQTAITFPRDAGTYAVGSMSVSLAGARRVTTTCCTVYTGNTGQVDVTSVGTGTLAFASPVTGNSAAGLNAMAAYRAANATGQFPTATTATLSAQSNWSAWTLIINPAPPCGTGGLSLAEPPSISFGSAALSGTNQTLTSSAAFTVDDQTNGGAGWQLAINPTQFTTGPAQLPNTALSLTGTSQTAGSGRCSAPTNTVTSFPVTLPAGSATKVFNATAGTGAGPSTVTLNLALAVPASARTGTYTSAWTVTLAAGP